MFYEIPSLSELALNYEVSQWAREEFEQLRARKQSFHAAGLLLLNTRLMCSESISSWFRAAPLAAHKDAAEEALLLIKRIDDCIFRVERVSVTEVEAVVSRAVMLRYHLECLLLPWLCAVRPPPPPLSPEVVALWQDVMVQTGLMDERANIFDEYCYPTELNLPPEAFMHVDPLCWWSIPTMHSDRMFDILDL
jgi:hypothetical protein